MFIFLFFVALLFEFSKYRLEKISWKENVEITSINAENNQKEVGIVHYPKLVDGHDWLLFAFSSEKDMLKTTTFVHDPECKKCREKQFED